MINEEGGVDPEQFRMEAMFDRMDAIGKGVLGLTIQCAQCHTHKFDPLTQAEYYRLFAFLNNAHEANVAVYTPDEQMKRADLFRQIREIEDGLKHRDAGLAGADGRLGEAGAGRPAGVDRRPAASSTPAADEKYYLLARRLVLAAGYAPTKHTRRVHRQDRPEDDHGRPAGTAQRPEPAAGRAGPVDQGDCSR